MLINNVITLLSKEVYSPALIASIAKSSLMYQYMQAEILKAVQLKFASEYAEEFMEKTKIAIKNIINHLQKNHLI